MKPRVTLRLDRGGTSSTGPYTLRVDGLDVGTVAPLSGGGWYWYAKSTALGIPWRNTMNESVVFAEFCAAKRDALAYVRGCLAAAAEKGGAS